MEQEFQQYYPTYKFKERDVVLIEFENALNIATSQYKLYIQLTSLLFGVISVLLTLFFKFGENNVALNFFNNNLLIFSIIYVIFGFIILKYFMEIQRNIILNTRKVVTLRRMLGLDYGKLQLTLPSQRLEGATEPFEIKFFPGWFHIVSIPFWILLISANAVWFLATRDNFYLNWYYGNIVFSVIYTYTFRTSLNDIHENMYLHVIKLLSKMLGLSLKSNFEYVIYRATLAYFEITRLKYNLQIIKKILIFIEDRKFYAHYGCNIKSLMRGFLSQIRYFRKGYKLIKSGGSTITMQLARTLFIVDYSKIFRRKFVEILLAFWIELTFSKEEILNYYLASVRFEKGVYGIAGATKYFFNDIRKRDFAPEEAFFMIERLSNINSTYSVDRVDFLIEDIKNENIVDINKSKLAQLYNDFVKKGKIKLRAI